MLIKMMVYVIHNSDPDSYRSSDQQLASLLFTDEYVDFTGFSSESPDKAAPVPNEPLRSNRWVTSVEADHTNHGSDGCDDGLSRPRRYDGDDPAPFFAGVLRHPPPVWRDVLKGDDSLGPASPGT